MTTNKIEIKHLTVDYTERGKKFNALHDVSFGVGAGAAKGDKKNGGMGALSGKMTPSAVLVISNGHTRLVNIKNQDSITTIIELGPDILDRISVKKNKDGVTDANAIETAFPKENEE